MNDSQNKQNVQTVNYADFETIFPSLIETQKTFYAYFYGGYDQNGISWCGDCNTSKPNVDEGTKILNNQNSIILYRFPLEAATWRDKSCLYRTHPKLKLTNIPTLILFQKGVEFTRLVEGQLNDKENVMDIFNLSKN